MQAVFEKIIEHLENASFWTDSSFDEDGYCNDDSEEAVYLHKAIEIVKKEAEQYKLYDTISIHTNGLEEGIRCAVCTNQIKSDTGCDGGCCVDENLVKRICDVIHKFECKPYQTKGE